jgi:hypothetical protein
MESGEQEQRVFLKCVKVRSKLRVRIISPGYYSENNCQFPRDIRQDGIYYSVPASTVKLITLRGRYYYQIKKGDIQILTEAPVLPVPKVKVFEDAEQEECMICYDGPKTSVFIPCGHFYTCQSCASKCQRCPICRSKIDNFIDKKEMDESE